MSDLKVGRIEFSPLLCSQGGIPYNKEHLDTKDKRIAELEGRIELLTAANEAILSESTEEIERLRDALDNEQAKGVHSCGPNCQRPLCVANREIERLQKHINAQAEYHMASAKRMTVEIERLRANVATWKEKARYCATEVLNDWELGRLSIDSKQAAEFIMAALREDEDDE